MSVLTLSEVHQKLTDYGVKQEALSKLQLEDAMELLNYKKAELKQYVDYDPSDFASESNATESINV